MFPLRTFCRQSNRIMAGVMKHVTDFNIHKRRESNHEGVTHSGADRNHHSESLMVLVLLNYRLPRFTPLLWNQGNQPTSSDTHFCVLCPFHSFEGMIFHFSCLTLHYEVSLFVSRTTDVGLLRS